MVKLTGDRLEGLVPGTPRQSAPNGVNGSTVKRKANFNTPGGKATKAHETSTPGGAMTPKAETPGGPYVFQILSYWHVLTNTQCLRLCFPYQCERHYRAIYARQHRYSRTTVRRTERTPHQTQGQYRHVQVLISHYGHEAIRSV